MRFILLCTLIPLLLGPLFSQPAFAGEWKTFVERNESGHEVRHQFRNNGNHYELKTTLPNGEEIQSYLLDNSGETIRWQYQDTSRNMELFAELQTERRIHLTGRHQGKTIDKHFDINEQPWNQRFQQGLTRFIKGTEDKTVFWAIGTRGKGELRISRFTAKRQPAQPVPASLLETSHKGPFCHIKLSLYGMLSIFWSGHYWYSANDAEFLFYQGKSSHLDGEVVLIKTENG